MRWVEVRGTADKRDDAAHVFFRLDKSKKAAIQQDELRDCVERALLVWPLSDLEQRVLTWMMCWQRLRVENGPFSLIGREIALLICDMMFEPTRGEHTSQAPPMEVLVQHGQDLCFAERFASDVVDCEVLVGLPVLQEYGVVYKDSGNDEKQPRKIRPGYVQKRVKARKGSKLTRLITVKADKDFKLRRALQDNE